MGYQDGHIKFCESLLNAALNDMMVNVVYKNNFKQYWCFLNKIFTPLFLTPHCLRHEP